MVPAGFLITHGSPFSNGSDLMKNKVGPRDLNSNPLSYTWNNTCWPLSFSTAKDMPFCTCSMGICSVRCLIATCSDGSRLPRRGTLEVPASSGVYGHDL